MAQRVVSGLSPAATVAVLAIVSVALVILVGSLASGWLGPHSKSYSISISSAQLVRALGSSYLLTFSVTNKGSEPVTYSGLSIQGAGNPVCTLTHVRGSTNVKPSESVEFTYRCAPVTLGEKYYLTVRTVEGASAWFTVAAVG
ncbi:MAG: hypothetical protein QW318_03395 [Candidatus Caldarchaeum sp.]